jgi:hypothetical protein
MTDAERQLLISTLWDAARRLVPRHHHEAFSALSHSMTAIYNAHGDVMYEAGRAAGKRDTETVAERRYQAGRAAGMLEESARMDRRDDWVPELPTELRSVH